MSHLQKNLYSCLRGGGVGGWGCGGWGVEEHHKVNPHTPKKPSNIKLQIKEKERQIIQEPESWNYSNKRERKADYTGTRVLELFK